MSIEEFREIENELFEDNGKGKMWGGILISGNQSELMRDTINELEKENIELRKQIWILSVIDEEEINRL